MEVTLTDDSVSVTAPTLRQAKRLLKKEQEQRRAAENALRQSSDMALTFAQSNAYRFLCKETMPRGWRFHPLGSPYSSFDILEPGDTNNYRANYWRDHGNESAEMEFYKGDRIIGTIENSMGTIGIVVQYLDEPVKVQGIGISGGVWRVADAPGITPEMFAQSES